MLVRTTAVQCWHFFVTWCISTFFLLQSGTDYVFETPIIATNCTHHCHQLHPSLPPTAPIIATNCTFTASWQRYSFQQQHPSHIVPSWCDRNVRVPFLWKLFCGSCDYMLVYFTMWMVSWSIDQFISICNK